MAVQAVTKRGPRTQSVSFVLADYVAAALAADAGTPRREWVMTGKARINGVQVKSGAAGVGAGNCIIDIKVNGTSIFGATGDRPTLVNTDSGFYTIGFLKPGNTFPVDEGDIVSWDVIQIGATSGPTRTSVSLSFGVAN